MRQTIKFNIFIIDIFDELTDSCLSFPFVEVEIRRNSSSELDDSYGYNIKMPAMKPFIFDISYMNLYQDNTVTKLFVMRLMCNAYFYIIKVTL